MAFGLCGASRTFQRIVSNTMEGLEGVYVFLDDILLATKTKESHFDLLEKVFSKLKENNIILNSKKWCFLKTEINYLGHII